jgi:hypothetical protein
MGQQDMLARLLRGNPDPSLPGYPVMQSSEGRGFKPIPFQGEGFQRMAAVLRGDVEPTPGEQMGMNVVRGFTEGPATIRAFHGSPHRFERFDMSRIGTGEGAQAYGHGLYFAGNEGVARSYRDALSSEVYRTPKGDIWSPDSLQHLNIRNQARQNPFELGFAISRAEDLLKTAPPATRPMLEADLAALRTLQDAGGLKSVPGHIYEVNLNTTPDRLLDWDAPLSRQGAIGEATRDVIANSLKIDASGIYNSSMPIGKFENALKGRDLSGGGAVRYLDNQAASELQGAGAVSSALRSAGIDGIQYLDAGSRAAGDGTRNYVMFDDKLIDILRRYGIAGTLGGGAAATAGTSE